MCRGGARRRPGTSDRRRGSRPGEPDSQPGPFPTSEHGTRVQGHAVEEDTFTANGKTLTSDPYSFNYHARFDADGNVVSEYFTGQVIVVRLPNGETFRAAGRTDWANVQQDFNTVPDTGSSKGREAFCDALAP